MTSSSSLFFTLFLGAPDRRLRGWSDKLVRWRTRIRVSADSEMLTSAPSNQESCRSTDTAHTCPGVRGDVGGRMDEGIALDGTSGGENVGDGLGSRRMEGHSEGHGERAAAAKDDGAGNVGGRSGGEDGGTSINGPSRAPCTGIEVVVFPPAPCSAPACHSDLGCIANVEKVSAPSSHCAIVTPPRLKHSTRVA